jgi:hypothetical protein
MKKAQNVKEDRVFHSIEEIIDEYLPADTEKDRVIAGDLGKKLAEDAIERVKRTLIIHKAK